MRVRTLIALCRLAAMAVYGVEGVYVREKMGKDPFFAGLGFICGAFFCMTAPLMVVVSETVLDKILWALALAGSLFLLVLWCVRGRKQTAELVAQLMEEEAAKKRWEMEAQRREEERRARQLEEKEAAAKKRERMEEVERMLSTEPGVSASVTSFLSAARYCESASEVLEVWDRFNIPGGPAIGELRAKIEAGVKAERLYGRSSRNAQEILDEIEKMLSNPLIGNSIKS